MLSLRELRAPSIAAGLGAAWKILAGNYRQSPRYRCAAPRGASAIGPVAWHRVQPNTSGIHPVNSIPPRRQPGCSFSSLEDCLRKPQCSQPHDADRFDPLSRRVGPGPDSDVLVLEPQRGGTSPGSLCRSNANSAMPQVSSTSPWYGDSQPRLFRPGRRTRGISSSTASGANRCSTDLPSTRTNTRSCRQGTGERSASRSCTWNFGRWGSAFPAPIRCRTGERDDAASLTPRCAELRR
jgi:hypothetical protein